MPEGAVATPILDADTLVDRMVQRMRAAEAQPKPGAERLVRFGQDGAWEIIGESQPWWSSFAQHAPEAGALIEMTSEGPKPLEAATALERLQSYEFGQRGAWLDVIERPLNDAFRQFPYLGSILVGGVPALLASEAIDGFVDGSSLSDTTKTWVRAGAKAATGIGVPLLIGSRLMSRTGQIIFGGTMLLSAALDFSQVDKIIKNAIIWLRNLFRPAGNKLPFAQTRRSLGQPWQTDTSHMLEAGDWEQTHGIGDVTHRQVRPGSGGPGADPLAAGFGR